MSLAVVVPVACSTTETSSPDGDAPPTTLTPVSGGSLVVNVPAEPNGFDPSRAALSPSAFEIIKSSLEPLAALDQNGTARPYLAESITSDDSFTVWTIVVRPDITFHDGSPLDAAAVKANLDDRIGGLVTSGTLLDVADDGITVVDPTTVTVTMKRPWAHFPLLLVNQVGLMVSPASFATEESLATIAVAPVGTGPFTWQSWERGVGVSVARYERYWQRDADDVQLPYLDEVSFRFVPDPVTLVQDIPAGDANAFISTAPGVSATATAAGLNIAEERTEGSELFAVLNTSAGKTFADLDLRRAAASAIDRDDMNDTLYGGQMVTTVGPTSAESPWGQSTTYPDYDPDAASALVEQAKADGLPTTIVISIVSNTENLAYAQYMATQWDAVGFTTSIDASAENVFAIKLVTAAADVSMFNYWADSDPDQLWHLMSEQTAVESGVGLNFARWRSDVAEQALTEGRQSTDVETRRAAYQRLWDEMGKDVPLLFLFHTPTTVGWAEDVHGMDTFVFPDGTPGIPFVWGNGFLTWTWVDP